LTIPDPLLKMDPPPMIKSLARRFVPARARIGLRVLRTRLADRLSGISALLVDPDPARTTVGESWLERVTIEQRINASQWAENKVHNLRLAASKFQNLPLEPGRVFSYWRCLGEPSVRAGYKVGINIIKGRLDFDVGGGLCQLSGLLYHLALTAGLEIVERHAHSVDLYTDETRYTPLGADATTAYGYKDLRLRNTLGGPLCFRVRVGPDQVIGSLCAPVPLVLYELEFRKSVSGVVERVETWRRGDGGVFEIVCEQRYVIGRHDARI